MSKRALSKAQVDALLKRGDDGNYWVAPLLYLCIRSQGTRAWLGRYQQDGRTRWHGLGPASGIGAVSLSDARDKAERLRVAVRDGADPNADKRAKRSEARKARAAAPTPQRRPVCENSIPMGHRVGPAAASGTRRNVAG